MKEVEPVQQSFSGMKLILKGTAVCFSFWLRVQD